MGKITMTGLELLEDKNKTKTGCTFIKEPCLEILFVLTCEHKVDTFLCGSICDE